jgi:hypothetical protein
MGRNVEGTVVTYFIYYSGMCLEGLRKTIVRIASPWPEFRVGTSTVTAMLREGWRHLNVQMPRGVIARNQEVWMLMCSKQN